MKAPESLQEAVVYFSDPERAFVHAVNMRWPEGKIACPRCGGLEHSFIKTRLLWFCKGCKKQFTVKVGTVFEDSALGLDKWMTAVWMLTNCKNGVSSYEIGRALKVSQKAAWFMLHRIREAMKNKTLFKLGGSGGPVEVDETFIGGKAKNMHRDKRIRMSGGYGMQGGRSKTIVIGMLERGGNIQAQVIPDRRKTAVSKAIAATIDKGSHIMTDEHGAYLGLSEEYIHEIINHAEAYVRGNVSTNGIENFWSLLKRGIAGTYVSVEPFHLDHYLDEQMFRYNNRATKWRKVTDADRFRMVMSQVGGRRLTYAQLTGKGTDSLHHPAAGTGPAEPF